ncbi:MAG: hypothetical protein FWB73_04070 [Treponema sp.]|nr:hypothetical protein [Treponema sp.]
MKIKINITFLLIVFLIVIYLFGACNDEIFYFISHEVEVKDPKIKGSPTNIVLFNGKVYVASGKRLYSYKKAGAEGGEDWSSEALDMYIGQLASTDNYLYAMLYRDERGSIHIEIQKMDTSGNWTKISEITGVYTIIQKIYSANNNLYIGAQKPDTNEYAIHVLDSNGDLEKDYIKGIADSPLKGACFSGANVFLCTGSGLYINDKIIDDSPSDFTGIITLPDSTVVAITRKGSLYRVETDKLVDDPDNPGEQIQKPAVTFIVGFSDGRWTTGAIALWQESSTEPANKLLLVGRTDFEYSTSTGHTYGYLELELKQDGGLVINIREDDGKEESGRKFKDPGTAGEFSPSNTTVTSHERYTSSMGAIPVNSILQVPSDIDSNMPIFASTQKEGVWSCKERGSEAREWNAED